jgi:TrmH family RNA methyltransferase
MEKEITSVNNELVKQVVKLQQRKYRDEEKKFLLEGFKSIEEAFKSGIDIEQVFVNKDKIAYKTTPHPHFYASQTQQELLPLPQGERRSTRIILTTEPVLKKISTTDSAPEAVAVAKQKIFTLDDIKSAKKVVLLENIKDLGNLGTILRTAKAFNQDAIILFGDTVDLYNPKCVRSAVGNLWKIPVVQVKDLAVLKSAFVTFEKVATFPKSEGTINLKVFKAKSPYLIMFGSEADGLSQELIDFATKKITIEMNSEVESLNLSVSVGIILHSVV